MRHFIKLKINFWVGFIAVILLLPSGVSASTQFSMEDRFSAIVKTGNRDYHLTYTVKKKDNLWNIARRLGLSMDTLIQANHIHSPDMIFPGERLVLSGNKNLPLRFEVTKIKIPNDQSVRVDYPRQSDIMSPSVPFAYYPGENHSASNFHYKISVIFENSLNFFHWLNAQGFSGKPQSGTFHSSPSSPQPGNLNQLIFFQFNWDRGKNIPTIGSFYKSFSPDTAPPPPRSV